MNRPYYFDVLLCHPRPAPGESLTGYLTRLAQLNGLKSLRGLNMVCFPEREPTSAPISDHPLASWDTLVRATACPEPVLQATTFYYLVQKFGHSFRSHTVGQFLKNSLSQTLRYCPTCLVEHGFYALPWRFLTLSGCHQHGGRLRDRCGHCGQAVPLLASPLEVGICPGCRKYLGDDRADPMSEAEWRQATAHYQDLCFLLQAQSLPEIDVPGGTRVGLQLVYWRLKRGLTAAELSRQIGLSNRVIYALEGRAHGGASFERYVQYVAFLGLTLRQLFSTSLPTEAQGQNWRTWCRGTLSREQVLVEQVQATLNQLVSTGQPVNQNALSRHMGVSIESLRCYPRVRAILDDVIANRQGFLQQQALKREQELLQRVQVAINQLRAEHQTMTHRAISRTVGVNRQTLNRYPRVRTLVETVVTEAYLARRQQRQQQAQALQPVLQNTTLQREAELMAAVQAAIELLQAAQKPVTQMAIGHIVGLHPLSLQAYPRLRPILDQVAVERYLARQRQARESALKRQHGQKTVNVQRENTLVETVQAAINCLEKADKPVTQGAVAQMVGLSRSRLLDYPRIKEIFTRLSEKHAQFIQQQRQQREQLLVEQVQTAIQQLETSHQPLFHERIAQLVGVSASKLRYYPQVRALLEEAKAKVCQTRMAQAQQRDQALVQQTKQATETLARLGQPVTKSAIGKIVGLHFTAFRRYPQAHKTLNHVTGKNDGKSVLT